MTEHDERPHAPVETRDIDVQNIDYSQRIITVIAAPYEEFAPVLLRGDVWKEVFERGAFDAVANRPNRVRVNRGHDKQRTVGKVVQFRSTDKALIADVRIAKTPLGDETLALAAEDMLSASVGFAALPSWMTIDTRSKTRRIRTAHLDHLSFVESPAYEGADVVEVRGHMSEAAVGAIAKTPLLNQFAEDPVLRWASERLNK